LEIVDFHQAMAAFEAWASQVGQIGNGVHHRDDLYATIFTGFVEPRSGVGRVSRRHRLSATVRNCTRDEGGPFETGSQVQVSSHRKLLSSRAMVASVAETSGPDPGRQG
jgi:hypothetical protein